MLLAWSATISKSPSVLSNNRKRVCKDSRTSGQRLTPWNPRHIGGPTVSRSYDHKRGLLADIPSWIFSPTGSYSAIRLVRPTTPFPQVRSEGGTTAWRKDLVSTQNGSHSAPHDRRPGASRERSHCAGPGHLRGRQHLERTPPRGRSKKRTCSQSDGCESV